MVVCTRALSQQITALSCPNMLIHWLVQLVCIEAVQMAAASLTCNESQLTFAFSHIHCLL